MPRCSKSRGLRPNRRGPAGPIRLGGWRRVSEQRVHRRRGPPGGIIALIPESRVAGVVLDLQPGVILVGGLGLEVPSHGGQFVELGGEPVKLSAIWHPFLELFGTLHAIASTARWAVSRGPEERFALF